MIDPEKGKLKVKSLLQHTSHRAPTTEVSIDQNDYKEMKTTNYKHHN